MFVQYYVHSVLCSLSIMFVQYYVFSVIFHFQFRISCKSRHYFTFIFRLIINNNHCYICFKALVPIPELGITNQKSIVQHYVRLILCSFSIMFVQYYVLSVLCSLSIMLNARLVLCPFK